MPQLQKWWAGVSGEMAFLTSRNKNKLVSIVWPEMPWRWGSVHVPMLYRSIILPSFVRCQVNAVGLATKFLTVYTYRYSSGFLCTPTFSAWFFHNDLRGGGPGVRSSFTVSLSQMASLQDCACSLHSMARYLLFVPVILLGTLGQ